MSLLDMSREQNRAIASQQYFELRNELNLSNKTKNLKTDLEFEIRDNKDQQFIIIKSTGAEHGLRVATYQKREKRWFLFNDERYSEFYKYLYIKIQNLNETDFNNINTQLTSWLYRLWMS